MGGAKRDERDFAEWDLASCLVIDALDFLQFSLRVI
jgi:hypothetical protein